MRWLLCVGLLLLGMLSALTGAMAAKMDDQPQTFGTAGKEQTPLEAGREAELFRHEGAGCLTHMWFGGAFPHYGRTRIRVYVDGERTASIDMQMLLGAGVGFEDDAAPWGVARIGKTGGSSGVYNTYRIPFGKSVRVTAQRDAGEPGSPAFWWIIRGSTHLPVTVGGVRLPDSARLHLYTHENFTVPRLQEFDLCHTSHAGALYQVTLAGQSDNFNYLEAMMRAYIDGAQTPMFLSSGLEDYFLGTYYFNRGRYYTPVAGLTHLDEADHSFSAYRFHDDDPIFFAHGLRLTCRCGEQVGDHVFGDPHATTYTSYVWVYEW
ncbi:MAG: DUF2961 domain-containing protein [Armatimonadota bacterium]|nr:DUF2961 domain-containing protein [Armatimonadota bacterium]